MNEQSEQHLSRLLYPKKIALDFLSVHHPEKDLVIETKDQDILERYLQQQSWEIGLNTTQQRFPDENLKIYDPTAGSDRTITMYGKPQNITIGNPYSNDLDQQLQDQGVMFVSALFPDLPVEDDSQHAIFMNGFDLFNLNTLTVTKPDNISIDQYLESILLNLRKKIKKGGQLIMTPGLEAKLQECIGESTEVLTLGPSVLTDSGENSNYDWQTYPGNNTVSNTYKVPEKISSEQIENLLKKTGWKMKTVDTIQQKKLQNLTVNGTLIPATMSVHNRLTYLRNIRAKLSYPVFFLEAV